MRTLSEIKEQLYLAEDNNNKYPGMSYEEGVAYALRWVLGESDNKPMED